MLGPLRRRSRPLCVACGRPLDPREPTVQGPGGEVHEECAYGRFSPQGKRRRLETK